MKFISPRSSCRLFFVLALTVACWAGTYGIAGQTPKSLLAAGGVDTARTANAPAQGTATEARVKIGPGDLIEVHVYDEADLNQTVRINDLGDGTFNFVGSLHVAGLTTDQAGDLLACKLQEGKYLRAPQVQVIIREYNSQQVSVVGELNKPGVYNVLGSQTLLDVVAAAGGTTPFAGPELTIQRSADGSIFTVQLSKDAQASLASDIRIYPGDKVIVPRAGLVYVLGDVGRPGGFVMENDGKLTLLEALAMAGGNNQTASLSRARLIRKTATGYTEVPIALKKIIRGEEAAPQLQTEDILYIPSNAVKSAFSHQVPSVISAASGAAIFHSMP